MMKKKSSLSLFSSMMVVILSCIGLTACHENHQPEVTTSPITGTTVDFHERTISDTDFNHYFGPGGSHTEIQELQLSGARFNHALLVQLPPTLEKLDLSRTQLTCDDIQRISHLTALTSLNLSENEIDAHCAQRIASSESLQHLLELNLQLNRISTAGAIAIANSRYLQSLRVLDLSSNHIETPGVIALAFSHSLQNHLVALSLADNPLIAASALAITRYLQRLRLFIVSYEQIALAEGMDETAFREQLLGNMSPQAQLLSSHSGDLLSSASESSSEN